MNKFIKPIIIAFSVLALMFAGFGVRYYVINQIELESFNICQDDDLVARLIVNNINPFTKFKFIKKRNTDCKVLLATHKEDALEFQKSEFCSYLDSSTNSLTMLIYTYVHDMYDRETASKEFRSVVPLMTPYNYCPQYIDNMYTLIQIKKKLGL